MEEEKMSYSGTGDAPSSREDYAAAFTARHAEHSVGHHFQGCTQVNIVDMCNYATATKPP